nr:extensin-like [Penaeus vannamei]
MWPPTSSSSSSSSSSQSSQKTRPTNASSPHDRPDPSTLLQICPTKPETTYTHTRPSARATSPTNGVKAPTPTLTQPLHATPNQPHIAKRTEHLWTCAPTPQPTGPTPGDNRAHPRPQPKPGCHSEKQATTQTVCIPPNSASYSPPPIRAKTRRSWDCSFPTPCCYLSLPTPNYPTTVLCDRVQAA